MTKFAISWEADDGYVGGTRPQETRIDPNHFDADASDEEIREALLETLEDDFRQKVTLSVTDAALDAAVKQIRAAFVATE